ncbi:MAG: NAD(P)H-dependent oxidoreductase subunit E [Verrucomicrobia bacterium]|nr:NAD(P)H-dependent oxidoreductase subunit E [Verrucomicrobiota bacterium]
MSEQKQISHSARLATLDTTHPSGDPRFADLDRTMESYNFDPTSLIQILHAAQQMFGYLSADVLRYISTSLKLPISHVYGVVTFYHLFTMKPRGKHQIMVCRGTGCHVRGATQVLEALQKELGIREGETTKDGLLSLATARCIGACALAPAISVDDDVYGKLSPDKVKDLVKNDLKKYV